MSWIGANLAPLMFGGMVLFMLVGYPAAFDFLFVYWYLIRFTGESPFSHSALDLKTYAVDYKMIYDPDTNRDVRSRG